MTLTFRRTRSTASSGNWSTFSAHRQMTNAGALDVAEVTQARPEGLDSAKLRGKAQEPDPRGFGRLLRAGSERPRHRRATKQRDELAPFHSITSSAVASSVAGTVRRSIRAV
jgi:hypothetical protein